MFFRNRTHGVDRYINAVMLLQLFGRPSKRIVGPKIHHRSLQPMRIPPAVDLCGLLERAYHGTASTIPKCLLVYFDLSEDRVPIEVFFCFRLTSAFAAYSCSFF